MSVAEGQAEAVKGMNGAYRGATQDWKDRAATALDQVISANTEFTTDKVWAADPSLDDGITENRAMGGVMSKARAQGLIVTTNRTEPSSRTVSHSRPLRIWRVL
jgi:hypothetical protein